MPTTGEKERPNSDDSTSADHGTDEVIGRVIGGNFRVVKKIGAGAMGDVYQAEQLSLGKMVALKLLRSEFMGDDNLIKRFELEARSASLLDHPNSIHIIDFGRDGDLLFIAMELLAGIDLAQLVVRDGALPIGRAARIMDQVLAALDEAHAQGIVHRDLKPGNIMLVSRRGEPDFVKVCDFGIAKVQTSREGPMLTMKGLVCGTPEYMSPEQARGEPVDGRSDLYAVAIILYQLVTGQIPFTDSSPVGILSKHLTEPPMPPSLRRRDGQIPPALDALVLHGLAKNPEDRPQTAAEFRQTLHTALAHIVERWPGQGTPTPNSMPAQVRRSQAITGAETIPVADALKRSSEHQRHDDVAPRTTTTRRPGRVWLGAAGLTAMLGFAVVSVTMRRQAGEPTPDLSLAVPKVIPAVAVSEPVPPPAYPADPADNRNKIDLAKTEPANEQPATEQAARTQEAPSRSKAVVSPRATKAQTKAAQKNKRAAVHAMAAPAQAVPVASQTTGLVPATPPPAPAAAPPAPSLSPISEAIRDAERMLGQGDAVGACKRAEDARRLNPKLPVVYRLLGKCSMRAGAPDKANEHFRRYLELAPDASDAAFIKSIVK